MIQISPQKSPSHNMEEQFWKKNTSTMCQGGKQTDRQIMLQPTARHPHIDDQGKKSLLDGPIRTRKTPKKNSYTIFLQLLHILLCGSRSSSSSSSSSMWLSFFHLSIHFGEEGLWFHPVFLSHISMGGWPWLQMHIYIFLEASDGWGEQGDVLDRDG